MTRGELRNAIRRALNILDEWNDCTGAVSKGSGWYWELQSVVEDAVHCGAQAATGDFRPLECEAKPDRPKSAKARAAGGGR